MEMSFLVCRLKLSRFENNSFLIRFEPFSTSINDEVVIESLSLMGFNNLIFQLTNTLHQSRNAGCIEHVDY